MKIEKPYLRSSIFNLHSSGVSQNLFVFLTLQLVEACFVPCAHNSPENRDSVLTSTLCALDSPDIRLETALMSTRHKHTHKQTSTLCALDSPNIQLETALMSTLCALCSYPAFTVKVLMSTRHKHRHKHTHKQKKTRQSRRFGGKMNFTTTPKKPGSQYWLSLITFSLMFCALCSSKLLLMEADMSTTHKHMLLFAVSLSAENWLVVLEVQNGNRQKKVSCPFDNFLLFRHNFRNWLSKQQT